MPQTVAERTPAPPVELHALGDRLLQEARAESGRAAITLAPAPGAAFQQTVVALCAGQALDPQHWNGPATVVVLDGVVGVSGMDGDVTAGAWTTIADDSEVVAHEDATVLLTVVLGQAPAVAHVHEDQEPHLGPKGRMDDRTGTDMGL